MTKEELIKLKEDISALSEEDKKERDLYLRGLANGDIQGPPVGYPSIDKPWLKHYPTSAVTDCVPTGSMYDYLYSCIKDSPNDVLIEFCGRKITAGEILRNIDSHENYLKMVGIKEGDVVALALANQPESVYFIYALNKMGAIPCNIDPRLNADDIKRDLVSSGAKSFIGIPDTYSKVKQISKNYSLDNIFIVSPLNSSANSIVFNAVKLMLNVKDIMHGNYVINKSHKLKMINLFDGDRDNAFSNENVNKRDQLAVIVHTGGTTGKHKGVHISNGAINTTVDQHKYLMENVEYGDTLYNPMPAFMSYGMTTMHLCLCSRLHMYMMPTSSPKTFGKEIKDMKPNIIYGGPIHYQSGRMSKDLKKEGDYLSNTKIAVSGGEKINLEEEKRNNEFYKKRGFQDEIFNGYGASEMCGVFSVKQGKKNSLGSVGYPFPKNSVCIVDPDTKEELYGENNIGELLLSGESLMLGYDIPEESNKVIHDGWFNSGDLGYINEDGELFITGRKKRQFVSGVDKVYCPLIEEIVESLPMVEKCVVVGVSDDDLRKVPYIFIELSKEYQNVGFEAEIEEQIKKLVQNHINKSSVPRFFDFSNKILYTSQGKIDFVSMEKEAEQNITNQQQNMKKRKTKK